MDWGMQNRMSKLFKKDGHAVWLAIDHGYFLGPVSKLEEPAETVKPLIPFTDALMLTRGVLRNCIDGTLDIPKDDLKKLFAIDKDGWLREAADIEEFFKKFGSRMPREMWSELDMMKKELMR